MRSDRGERPVPGPSEALLAQLREETADNEPVSSDASFDGRFRMSDISQGDGWWVASDGRWYPPQDHPNDRPTPPTKIPVPRVSASSDSADEPSTDPSAVAVATTRQCVNGHEMPESHVFCSICGSERSDGTATSTSLDPQIVTGTCANGHVMEESHTHCTVCGGARSGTPGKSEVDGPASPSMARSTEKAKPVKVVRTVIAVAGVIAIVIIILVVTLGGGGGGSTQTISYKDGYVCGQAIANGSNAGICGSFNSWTTGANRSFDATPSGAHQR